MPLGTATAQNAAVNAMFGDAKAAGQPANLYVALFVGGAPGTGTEVTGNGYARVLVANTNAAWSTATAGVKTNLGSVTFLPAGPANWGTVTHVALFDALTAGNMWDWGALDVSTAVNSGWTAKFAAGQLRVSVV
jgi:hypothetical protein